MRAQTANPIFVRWAVVLLLAVPAHAARLTESGSGAAYRIELSNATLTAVINPGVGGRIERFAAADADDLTQPLAPGQPGGLLSDHVWQQDYWTGDWLRAPYAVEILATGPEVASVRLTASGTLWRGITISKTITLKDQESGLRADYVISAGAEVDPRCRPDFHFHQALRGDGQVFLPAEAGVLAKPRSSEAEGWVYEPAGNWLGYVRGAQEAGNPQEGLVAVFDTERLRAFRVTRECSGRSHGTALSPSTVISEKPTTTMAWTWRKVQMTPGEDLTTSVWLAPIGGLSRVDGASSAAAGSLELDGTSVQLNLVAFRAIGGELQLRWRSLGEGSATTALAAQPLQLDRGARKALTVAVDLPHESGVIVAEAVAGDATVLHLERPRLLTDGVYHRGPGPRAFDIPDSPTWSRFQPKSFDFSCKDVGTPHWDWVPRWSAGRPRVLAIMATATERAVVELAQRFDLDLTCATVSKDVYYLIGDRVRSLKEADLQAALSDKLARDYDLIIMTMYSGQFESGSWNQLPDRLQRAVMAKVEAGTGLLLMQNGPADKQFPRTPLEVVEDYSQAPWRVPDGAPPILAALPFAALPRVNWNPNTRMRLEEVSDFDLDEAKALADAVLASGDSPLVAAGHLGKGRFVQALTGAPLLPGMNRLRSDNPQAVMARGYDYWEYMYAMIARLVYWAAAKDSPVQITAMTATDGNLTVSYTSALSGAVVASVRSRNAFGELLAETDGEVKLTRGGGQFTAAFSGAAPRFVDLIVANDRGVLAFAAAAVPVPGPHISLLRPDGDWPNPDAETTIVAELQGDLPADARVDFELRDGGGRTVARTSMPAGATMTASLPVARVNGQWYEVRASLGVAGEILHQTRTEGVIAAPSHPSGYRAYFWSDIGGLLSEDVKFHSFQLYRDLGMNANWGGATALTDDIHIFRRLNWPHAFPTTGMDASRGVLKYPDRRAKPPPAPTKLKIDLGEADDQLSELMTALETDTAATVDDPFRVATPAAPGIHHPGVNAAKQESAAAVAQRFAPWYGLMYSCADENDGAVPDTCFGKETLAFFRDWLQATQYADIAALNAEWATDYERFDEVIPLTEAEARRHGEKAGTYAPWVDHRNFMKWAYAQQAAAVVAGVQSIDPGAPVGASGTQEGATYNSRDWWHLARAYSGLSAYGGLQTVEQESYSPQQQRYIWQGYSKPNPRLRRGLFETMFRQVRGFGIFHDESHVNPDFTMSQAGQDLRAVLRELRQGLGSLLAAATVSADPVYLLQSPSSICVGYITGHDQASRASRYGAAALLEQLGLQYRALSYEQLAMGTFTWGRPKLIVLPFAVALSEAEIATLNRLVSEGCVVAMDAPAGEFSGHGRRYQASPLASDKLLDVPGLFADYHTISRQSADDTTNKTQALFARADAMLQAAGVVPQAVVCQADGRRAADAAAHVKRYGETRLVLAQQTGFSARPEETDLAAYVELAEPGFIYDVVAGQYLGHGARIPLTLSNDCSRVFAVLPVLVDRLSVTVAPTARRGEDCHLACGVGGAGAALARVFRLDVTAPDGTAHAVYSRDFVCPQGSGDLTVPFAFNDAIGAWRVQITDVATGTTDRRELLLQ